MAIEWLHPSILFFIGALVMPFIKGQARKAWIVFVPAVSIALVFSMSEGVFWTYAFLGQNLILGNVDKLSLVFAYVFTIMSLIGSVYALHVDDAGEHIAAFLYVGSSIGVVFAGDYLTLFVFWEIMAFASAYLVFARRDEKAVRAGFRYILVHLFGGACLLGGIVLHYTETGSLIFNGPLGHGGGLSFYLILIGFMLNAAVPPLHAWLTDAYPEATITGAVFMCAFTTKTAVYVLVRAFPGTELLVWMGTIMALYGVVYAVLENDARRLLAYHIISQVGYMVAGVGMGSYMALNGAVSHAFAHILYKSLLFMGTGAVIYMTGKRKLTELGGIYKYMPITFVLYMVGGFAISAFPLFSGFVSKSMVVSAAGHGHRPAVALLLTLASAGTFLHTGLKLPYYMFFGKGSDLEAKEPPTNMLIAMGMAAFMCVAIGVFPRVFYSVLPYPVHFEPYTADHVTSALGILMFTALGFFLLLKKLDPEPTVSVDTDWFYRKGSRVFMWLARRVVAGVDSVVAEAYEFMVLNPAKRVAAGSSSFDLGVIDGIVNLSAWMTRMSAWFAHKVDIYLVDGLVNSVASLVGYFSNIWRRLQTGYLQNYAFIFILGLLFIIGKLLLDR